MHNIDALLGAVRHKIHLSQRGGRPIRSKQFGIEAYF